MGGGLKPLTLRLGTPVFTIFYDEDVHVVELSGVDMSMLTRGLGAEMPSVDEDADDIRDRVGDANAGSELCPIDDEPVCNDSSDSEADEENFAAGLSFDEATDRAAETSASAAGGGDSVSGESAVLVALSSPAVSSLMSTAASGLTVIRDAVSLARNFAASQAAPDNASDNDVLDAEFEFLNDEEFNQFE